MNRYQKLAWFNLIVIMVTIALATTAITVEVRIRGYSTLGIWFLAPLALLRLNPFLFRKPESREAVVTDERDTVIVKRALSCSYTSFWIVFVLSSFASFLLIGPRNSVPTITLPLIAIAGALFMKIVSSVAILVQYGSGGRHGDE